MSTSSRSSRSSGGSGSSGSPHTSRGSASGASFRDDPEYVRRRRQIIRDHHPDRGGSEDTLIAELDALDEEWRRRTRPGVHDIRLPGFIPDDIARQATDLAEQYTDEVFRRAEEVQERARRVVGTQTPRLRRMRRQAGKAATSAARAVQERLPRRFPGARRYTDTTSPRTGTSRTTRNPRSEKQ